MKNHGTRRMLALAGVLAMLGSSAFAVWLDFDVNTVVPDNDPLGVQDTQTLSGFDGVIQSVYVQITITGITPDYAYNGDYYVTLQHSSGYAVLLNGSGITATDPLGYDNNGFNIVFALGGNDIHLYQNFAPSFDGNGSLTGTWGVDGRNVDPDLVLDTSPRTDMLASFTGIDPNGEWTIFVADMNQNGTAVFESWGLDVTVVPEPSTALLFVIGGIVVWMGRRRSTGC